MTKKEEIAARLALLIKEVGPNQSQFGDKIQVSQSQISQVLGGHQAISGTVIVAIAEHLHDVNMNWLLRGDAPMFLSSLANNDDAIQALSRRVQDVERRIVGMEAQLTQLGEQGKG